MCPCGCLSAGGKGTLTVVDNRTGKKYTVGGQHSRGGGWLPVHQCQPPNIACTALASPAPAPTPSPRQLEISEGGTINAAGLKQITAGGDGVGLRTYDPG